jgi:hypothetical protein
MYLTYWGQGDRNTLALTTGGGAGLHVSTGGNVVVGDFTASNFTGSGKFVVPAGNVGIGTTNPQQVLHVSAGAAGEIVSMRNSNGNFGLHFMVNDGTDSLGYGLAGLNAVRVASNEHFAIVTGSTPTPRLVVRETGNVGIGTTTPGYKLDVNGGVNAVWEQSSVITKMALAGPAFELLAHVSPSCSSGTLYAAGGPVNVGGTNVDWSKVQFSTGIGGASLGNQNGAAICGWYSKTCVSDKTVRARITTTGVAYDVNDYTCTKSWGTVWPGWGWYSDSSGTWSPGGYWTTLACCQ